MVLCSFGHPFVSERRIQSLLSPSRLPHHLGLGATHLGATAKLLDVCDCESSLRHVSYGSWSCENAVAWRSDRMDRLFDCEFRCEDRYARWLFGRSGKNNSSRSRACEVFTHGVIPGSSHTQALGISSPRIDE